MILHKRVKILHLGKHKKQHLDQSLKTDEFWDAELLRHLSVRPLKEFVVDEISTKLHLPFFEGKSCLIFQLVVFMSCNFIGLLVGESEVG